jgi:hypothetical protein
MVARRLACFLVVIACGCTTLAARPEESRAEQVVVLTAKYSGTYRFKDDYVNTTDRFKGELHTLETFTWVQTVNQTVVANTGEVQQETKKLVAQGTVHQNNDQGYSEDCTFTEIKPPGRPIVRLDVTAGKEGPTDTVNVASVSAILPFSASKELTVTGNNNNCNIYSSVLFSDTSSDGTAFPTFPNHGDAETQAFFAGLTAGADVKLSKLPKTLRHDSDQTATSSPYGGSETATRSIHSTLDIDGREAAGGKPAKKHTTPERIRREVLRDVRDEVVQALYPCLTAGTGIALFASPNPLLAVVVGGTMTAIAAPLCAIEIQIIKQLSLAYYDPPVRRYTVVAPIRHGPDPHVSLPACSQSDAQERAYCARLHAAAKAWVRSFGRVRDVATTLAITIGRESAAAKARNKAALRRQQRAGVALVPKLKAAAATQHRNAGKLAAVLTDGEATGSLSTDQSTQAIKTLLAKLSARGVPATQMRSAARSALTARPRDLIAVLEGG